MVGNTILQRVRSDEEWEAYHAIRKAELFDARGDGRIYNPNHPDDNNPQNLPYILLDGDTPVGVVRLDTNLAAAKGIVRTVAITKERQRQGLGLRMMNNLHMTAEFLSIKTLTLNANPAATEFYRKLGYSEYVWDQSELDRSHTELVQMMVDLELVPAQDG